MKVYQIYKTFESYHEDGVKTIEIPTSFIYTNKEIAERILETKQFCSDVNVMCDQYVLKELILIESVEDLSENYTEIFTILDRKALEKDFN